MYISTHHFYQQSDNSTCTATDTHCGPNPNNIKNHYKMVFHIGKCILFCIVANAICTTNVVCTSLQSVVWDCPIACTCDRYPDNSLRNNQTEAYFIEVKCSGQYWTQIPMLPNGIVKKLHMGEKQTIHITHLPDNIFEEKNGMHLEVINIKYSDIKGIGLHAFRNLENLLTLRISGKLMNLTSGILDDLLRLEILDLQKNLFTQIPESAICDAHNLRYLILTHNKITKLHFGSCFRNLHHLSNLYLKCNPVKTINPEDLAVLKMLPISVFDLSDCQLKYLRQKTLHGFSKLTSLYIGNNKIKVTGYQFARISHRLINIDLSGNEIPMITRDTFANLTNLKTLVLQRCGIQRLSFLSNFTEVVELQELYLSGNPLFDLSNTAFTCINLRNITSLYLSACKLQYVSPSSFQPLTSLVNLRLDHNNLTAKAFQVGFYGLKNTSTLTFLSMANSHLSDLNNQTFQFLKDTALQHLDMKKCEIRILRSGVFQYLPNLLKIVLSDNDIYNIEACVFPKTNHLSELYLDSNQLFAIPDAKSTQFENVQYLSLRKNAIQRISHNSLHNLKNLTHLILTKNDISLLETGCFDHSFQLENLDLSYNKISREIKNDFVGLQRLTFLSLKQNNIPKLTLPAFKLSTSLNHLILSDNKLLGKEMGILATTWSTLSLLQILDISNLQIANLPFHIFQGLINLDHLALSNNDLTGWDANVFRNQKKLRMLTITDNKINYITKEQFQYLISLRELHMFRNPFTCTCDLLSLVQWIENPKHAKGLYFGGVEDYLCESPQKWAKKPLLEFNISEDDCQSYIWFDIITAGGCLYIFIVTLSSVAYRKRWYIR